MRHQLYPNRVAVYATEENIKMFRFIYPQEPLTILHKESEPDYPEDLLNQYQYAPSPFDKSKARELGISNQELASLTEEDKENSDADE